MACVPCVEGEPIDKSENWMDELEAVSKKPSKTPPPKVETETGVPMGKSLLWGLTHIRGFKLPNKEVPDGRVGD